MTSGKKLTQEQCDAILRLASERNSEGEYLHTYGQIADALELNRRTIYRQVRDAAASWWKHTRWSADEPTCS